MSKNEFMCLNCGSSFRPKTRRSKRFPPIFCGLVCKGKYRTRLNEQKLKRCTTCKKEKPKGEFNKNKQSKYYSRCRECSKNCTIELNKRYLKSHGMTYDLYVKGSSPENYLKVKYREVKRRAKTREIDFDIEPQDLIKLFHKQNGLCRLSGEKLTHITNQNHVGTNISVDRIDSNKGYRKDNIQLVTYYVNIMKNEIPESEFIEICKKIILRKDNYGQD